MPKRIKDAKYYTKRYATTDLLDPPEAIRERCEVASAVSRKLDILPVTDFVWSGDDLHVQQCRVGVKSPRAVARELLLEALHVAARSLDEMAGLGFVHGDITPANLPWDGLRFWLVDIEPSFRQLRNGRRVWMSSTQIRSSNDVRTRTVTTETDKIGFYYSSGTLLHSRLNETTASNLNEYGGIVRRCPLAAQSLRELVDMSFSALLERLPTAGVH